MKNREAQEVIKKAGNKKDNYVNLAGIKARSLHLDSNVQMLAIKCYEEQMPKGWEYVQMKLRNLDRKKYQVVAIRHDRDKVEKGGFFERACDKPHYHILIRLINPNGKVNRKGQHVRSFLKGTGIVFRPCDEAMIANHGIETVGDWCAYVLYLTHETDKARLDGKEIYDRDEVVSNLSRDEVDQFREGYSRVSEEKRKLSKTDMAEIAKIVYELGLELKDYEEWNDAQPFLIQSHTKQSAWRERYERGVQKYIKEHGSDINRLCIFIKGSAGVGKTRTSEHVLREMKYDYLKIGGGGTGKYDDITCTTQALLVDDDTASNLLNMAESQICKAYRRNSGNPYWTGEILIVTSNKDIDTWALACGADETELQSVRDRFYICETVKAGSKTRLKVIEPSTRGNEEEQLWKYELFKKFQTEFHTDIDKFEKAKKLDFSDLNDFELKKVLEIKLDEIIREEKEKLENVIKGAYKFNYINIGKYDEKLKQSEKLTTMLRIKYYDMLVEAQNECCEGYPSVSYEEDAKIVNKDRDVWD